MPQPFRKRFLLVWLMIALTPHADGWILPVHAQPGARKAGVVGVHGQSLKLAVRERPVDGRANKALVEALRDAIGVKRSQVELIAGETSRDKKFLIRGLARAELEKRLTNAVKA